LERFFGFTSGYRAIIRDITQLEEAELKLAKTLEEIEAIYENLGVVCSLTHHDVRNKLSRSDDFLLNNLRS
jgi:hypothetical protein